MPQTQRLFDLFHPEHYDIYLDINRATKTFTGKSTVKGTALGDTVKLNQKYLTINEVKVNNRTATFNYSDKTEDLTISDVPAGEVVIEVAFTGKLTDTMMGIYPSYYQINGEKKQLIGTQFETTFARQAFPCLDEPAAKATFSLAIKYDEQPGETIIANQPEEKCVAGVHYFQETVRMSTYLVAFAFGDMQKKLTSTKSGVEIGVFATKAHKAEELDFALDIAKRAIEFFEEYYETPYPLAHSYQLALPDFSAGAMENWGLVTYRESCLLLDPQNSSIPTKQLVAAVVCHELAHQWFGDLVTMAWWDDLWLNESFANMMEYVAVDALEPEFKIWESFQTSDIPAALQRDATDGVQSVHVMVNDPAEIDAIFDSAIVYAKGARLLVMVRALLGDEKLRAGLKTYFAEHRYANAKGQDLWNALSAVSGFNVGEIMNSWLEQPGYPLVNANVVNGNLYLSQRQFFIGEHEDKQRLWQIPLSCNYQTVPELMRDEMINLGDYRKLKQANGNRPFILNFGNNSHFIVQYDQTLMDDILDNLDKLDTVTHLQILQDMSLLAKCGELSYAQLIPLVVKLSGSTSQLVQAKLLNVIGILKSFFTPESAEEKDLQALLAQLYLPQTERLGLIAPANESNDDTLVRPYVWSIIYYAEDQKCLAAMHELYLKHAAQPYNLPADMRYLILRNEIKNYNQPQLFAELFDVYVKHADPAYKDDLRLALTVSRQNEQLDEILQALKNGEIIKPQDVRSWYYSLLANPLAEERTWKWLRTEWKWLEKTLGGDMEFNGFIQVTAHVFNSEKRLQEFKEFFQPLINTKGLDREIIMDTKVIAGKVEMITTQKTAVVAAVQAALAE